MDLDDLGAGMESFNTCRWCPAMFTSASEFIEHENIHEQLDDLAGISSIPLECPWCEAVFDDRNEFDLHTDIHKQLEDLGAFMPAKRCKKDEGNSSPSPVPGPSTESDSFDPLPGPSTDFDDCISNQQSGGDNGGHLVYEIEKVGQKTFQNRVIDRHYRVKFNPDQALEGQKLSNLNVELENMFDVRGNGVNSLIGPNSSRANKRSILEIKNQDNSCLARAILLGFLHINIVTSDMWKDLIRNDSSKNIDDLVIEYKVCPRWYFKMIRQDQHANRQTKLIYQFCEVIDVPVDRFLTINDILVFEEFLDVDVLVVSARMGNKFLRVPPEDSTKKRLYVYLVGEGDSSHFHTIVNICEFFGSSKFCEFCLKPYQRRHDCKISCYVCNERGCLVDESTQISCIKCRLTCRSEECFDRHLVKRKRKTKKMPPCVTYTGDV